MIWTRAVISDPRTPIPNFRDFGGLPAEDGHRVRRGLLYRSVGLAGLEDEALAWVGGLGLRTVFDLRTAPERERHASHAPDGARLLALDVLADAGRADPAAFYVLMQDPPRASAELAGGASERFFMDTYRDFVRLPSARAAFSALYSELAVEGALPALVHCTTGKDRTGWAVAALQLFLGVPQDVVMAEYLRSDAEIRAAYGFIIDDFMAKGGDREVIEPLVGARVGYLEAALDEVRMTHGSIEGYLYDGLELDEGTLHALRATFLEPA